MHGVNQKMSLIRHMEIPFSLFVFGLYIFHSILYEMLYSFNILTFVFNGKKCIASWRHLRLDATSSKGWVSIPGKKIGRPWKVLFWMERLV